MIVYHDQKKNPQWQSLGHLLREQAEKIGARTLLRFEGESMSFAQVEENTNRLANVLRRHHVHKGDKVVVMHSHHGKIFVELAEGQIIPAELFFPVIIMLNGFP